MDWNEAATDNHFLGGDPYFQLRLSERSAYPEGPTLRPAIVRLKDGDVERFAAEPGVSAVPSFYTRPVENLESVKHCTALVTPEFIASLAGDPLISRITLLRPIDPRTALVEGTAPRVVTVPKVRGASDSVVMGVIDFGIAFAHSRFRLTPESTRIEYFWVQDGTPPVAGSSQGLQDASSRFDHDPAYANYVPVGLNPVPYGREMIRSEIDDLLGKLARRELACEDSLYRRASAWLGRHWWRSVSKRTAHGTHIMDLACGYDPRDNHERERKLRPIVAVQLPEAATADTSGENLDAYALDGIRYILDRADLIAKARQLESLPVVINFSYGNVAGPHDGRSDLEQAIDELIGAYPNLSVVIPAGNSHLGRLHASFALPGSTLGGRRPQEIRWRVLPDDRTPSFLEIWLPPGPPVGEGASGVGVTIKAPGGQVSSRLRETNGAGVQLSFHGNVLCEARYRYNTEPRDGSGRGMFLIALEPTVRSRTGGPAAPAGVWTVELENLSSEPVDVEAWIQRDDTLYGFRRHGRQSYFDQPCYRRFNSGGRVIEDDDKQPECVIKRAGSMNAIATGEKTIVIGGYVRASGWPARYSAGGPEPQRATWKRAGPDKLAVSDESLVHRGVLAAGTRSGSVVTLNGTSVAAPQIARRLAAELSKGTQGVLATEFRDPKASSLGRSIVRSLAKSGGSPQPPVERGGAGRVEPDDAIDRRQRRRRRRSPAAHSSGA